jgi:hypothetical protein
MEKITLYKNNVEISNTGTSEIITAIPTKGAFNKVLYGGNAATANLVTKDLVVDEDSFITVKCAVAPPSSSAGNNYAGIYIILNDGDYNYYENVVSGGALNQMAYTWFVKAGDKVRVQCLGTPQSNTLYILQFKCDFQYVVPKAYDIGFDDNDLDEHPVMIVEKGVLRQKLSISGLPLYTRAFTNIPLNTNATETPLIISSKLWEASCVWGVILDSTGNTRYFPYVSDSGTCSWFLVRPTSDNDGRLYLYNSSFGGSYFYGRFEYSYIP